jgi:hypothetical protein
MVGLTVDAGWREVMGESLEEGAGVGSEWGERVLRQIFPSPGDALRVYPVDVVE